MSEVKIRELEEYDLSNGFLNSLDSLRKASNLDLEKAKNIFKKIQSDVNHVIFVAIINDEVIGSTTMFIEQKFIHNGGKVSHIEDVVVSNKFQGLGIGRKLIRAALEYAKKNNCYKTILDCKDEVKHFYEKIGFKIESNCMRYDHNN